MICNQGRGKMGTRTKFLDQQGFNVPLRFRWSRFLKDSYTRRKFCKILADRDADEVAKQWAGLGVDAVLLAEVSKIIQEWCEWPSALFLPQDRCSEIIWERYPDLTFAEVSMEIEYLIPGLDDEIWSEAESLSFGELMQFLQKEFCRAGDSDIKLLVPDAVAVSKLVRRFPSLQSNYLKKTYSGFLFVRDEEKVKTYWDRAEIDFDAAMSISKIVEEIYHWPNCRFVPDDMCSVVFRDEKMKLRPAEIIKYIEQKTEFSVLSDLQAGIESISYGEFITSCSEISGSTRLSGS